MTHNLEEQTLLSYLERQKVYLESETAPADANFAGANMSAIPGVFNQLAWLALGRGPLDQDKFAAAFDFIRARRDCSDFALAGLLRILYRFGDHELVTPELRAEIEDVVLKFCYWYDQPGVAGMCFHTENHQILFHGCELLAGQLFPERVFANDGKTGAWHSEHGAALARQWMDQRARFGFVEWLSNCYYDEDLLALLTLVDFAADPEIRRQAAQLVDMLLLEIALHQFRGVLATTHGRTYARFLSQSSQAPTSAIAWMVFGLGAPAQRTNYTLVSLCTSAYRCPEVIQAIAHDHLPEVTIREHHGLSVDEAPRYGISREALEDQMFFWACQTARHPSVRPTALRLAEIAQHPWLVNFVSQEVDEPLADCRRLAESAGQPFDGDSVKTALSPVDLVTFRKPAYQLSCAQDFRPGKPGYQQHVWQAALGTDSIVYTSHPGTDDEDGAHTSRPNFWAGNRWLPRAAQHRNVLVCIHHVPADDPRPFSHAWFPRERFDLVVQNGSWVFARKGQGYLALYSQQPARWAEDGPYAGIELRANAPDNIWICELGQAGENGDFENFIQAILAAEVRCTGLQVDYASPSLGAIHFSWLGPLMVKGEEIPLHNYPRLDSPYGKAEIGEKQYEIHHPGGTLTWTF